MRDTLELRVVSPAFLLILLLQTTLLVLLVDVVFLLISRLAFY